MKPLFKINQEFNKHPYTIKILKVYPIGHQYASETSNFYLIDSNDFGNDVVSELGLAQLAEIKVYNLLSPDGISIERDKLYTSLRAVRSAFKRWAKNFTKQGYYSSNNGRIDLRDLAECCSLIRIV